MLFVHMQDHNKQHLLQMQEQCRQILAQHGWEARVGICALQADGMETALKEDALPALFVVEDEDRNDMDAFVKKLRQTNPFHYLVLLLRLAQDALRVRPAFYRPCGFLLKPTEQRMLDDLLYEVYEDYQQSGVQNGELFTVKIKNTIYPLAFEKILFFESHGKRVIARTLAQEYEFYDSLERISAQSPSYFLRVHKSYCVNLNCVQGLDYSSMQIIMSDSSIVYLSRSHKQELRKALHTLWGTDDA